MPPERRGTVIILLRPSPCARNAGWRSSTSPWALIRSCFTPMTSIPLFVTRRLIASLTAGQLQGSPATCGFRKGGTAKIRLDTLFDLKPDLTAILRQFDALRRNLDHVPTPPDRQRHAELTMPQDDSTASRNDRSINRRSVPYGARDVTRRLGCKWWPGDELLSHLCGKIARRTGPRRFARV
jgi:hypothetical protein